MQTMRMFTLRMVQPFYDTMKFRNQISHAYLIYDDVWRNRTSWLICFAL